MESGNKLKTAAEIKIVMDGLISEAQEIFQNSSSSYISSQISRFSDFSGRFDKFVTKFSTVEEKSVSPLRIFNEADAYLADIVTWLDTLVYFPDGLRYEHIWDAWQQVFKTHTAGLPEAVSINMPDDYWVSASGDTIYQNVARIIGKTGFATAKTWRRADRYLRHIINAEPAPTTVFSRSFNIESFLIFYVDLPVRRTILKHRLSLFRRTAEHLNRLQQQLLAMVGEFVLPDQLASFCRNRETQMPMTGLQALKIRKHTIEDIINSLKQALEDTNTDFFSDTEKLLKTSREKMDIAGTLLLPASHFGEERIEKERKTNASDLEKNMTAWRMHLRGELAEWKKNIELASLQLQAMVNCIDTINTIDGNIEKRLLVHFEDISRMLNRFLDKLKSGKNDTVVSGLDSFSIVDKEVLDNLRKASLPKLVKDSTIANPAEWLKKSIEKIQQRTDTLSDTHVIFQEKDLASIVPASQTVDISFKSLIQNDILMDFLEKSKRFIREKDDRYHHILENVTEIDQIMEFSLNAANKLYSENSEFEKTGDVVCLLKEATQRVLGKVETLSQEIMQVVEYIHANFPAMYGGFMQQVRELADNRKIMEIRLRLTKTKGREKILETQKSVLKNLSPRLSGWMQSLTNVFHRLRTGYFAFQKVTGLKAAPDAGTETLTKYLADTRKKISTLPYVYQSLFQTDPLNDNRFYFGREKEAERLKQELDRWQRGFSGSVAVVGEKGSGKTSFLNVTGNQLTTGSSVVRITFSGTFRHADDLLAYVKETLGISQAATWKELADQVFAQPDRYVCMAENIHNLYIRSVDGFEALEAFLLFVSNTSGRIFWLVSCAKYAWQYLDKLLVISRYFQETIVMGAIDRSEMREIILKRHRLSGYNVEFEIPLDLKNNRQFKRLDSDHARHAFLQERFFTELTAVSAGNIHVAIIYWLSAIKETSKEHILISAGHRTDFSLLHQLPMEELFTLAAVVQHGILTSGDHAHIFSQDDNDSLRVLNLMRTRGLLVQKGAFFSIHPFLYRPVTRTLELKNILH